MYTKRLSLSVIFAVIIIILHQYLQGIPDILQKITDFTLIILKKFKWYKTGYEKFPGIIIMVLIPILLSTLVSVIYEKIYNQKFGYKIATAWLVWLFLAIPHIIY